MGEPNAVSRRHTLAGLGAFPLTALTCPTGVKGTSRVTVEGSDTAGACNAFLFGTIDGDPQTWEAHNAGRPYSCELRRQGILRLELQSGDQWIDDLKRGASVERTMVQAVTATRESQVLPLSTDVWWAFSFLIEPGAPVSRLDRRNHGLMFADVHGYLPNLRAVPIQLEVEPEDRLAIQTHGDFFPLDEHYVLRGDTRLSRGQWHDLVLRINMDPSNAGGKGGAYVWLDGVKIYSYDGPLGYANDAPYAQFQIYRGSPAPSSVKHETVAICYANSEMRLWGSLERRLSHRPELPD